MDKNEKENYDKLWSYLGMDIDIDKLLDIFHEVGVLWDPSQEALADLLLGYVDPDDVRKILSREIIPDLISPDEDIRLRALEKMSQLGFSQKVKDGV